MGFSHAAAKGMERRGHRERLLLRLVWLCYCSAALSVQSQESSNAPPQPDRATAANALANFVLEKGFKIELVAAEPEVTAPVAMAFDENGRLFVVEMRDYPNRREVSPHLGRIRLLDEQD